MGMMDRKTDHAGLNVLIHVFGVGHGGDATGIGRDRVTWYALVFPIPDIIGVAVRSGFGEEELGLNHNPRHRVARGVNDANEGHGISRGGERQANQQQHDAAQRDDHSP
jgi:hypothetical protein